jgi:hypothetical protein
MISNFFIFLFDKSGKAYIDPFDQQGPILENFLRL